MRAFHINESIGLQRRMHPVATTNYGFSISRRRQDDSSISGSPTLSVPLAGMQEARLVRTSTSTRVRYMSVPWPATKCVIFGSAPARVVELRGDPQLRDAETCWGRPSGYWGQSCQVTASRSWGDASVWQPFRRETARKQRARERESDQNTHLVDKYQPAVEDWLSRLSGRCGFAGGTAAAGGALGWQRSAYAYI